MCIWKSFLDTKMLKVMNNNLYWEKEKPYQKRVSSVFFTFLTKSQIACETSFMWEKNYITRSVFWVFLSVLGNKALKSRAITLHGNKTNFDQELAIMCFELLTYQNAKTHAKHSFMEKQKILQKTCFKFFWSCYL